MSEEDELTLEERLAAAGLSKEDIWNDQSERNITREGEPSLETSEEKVFARALKALNRAKVPYLVGAAFARYVYTGIWRSTKDLDIFLPPYALKPAFDALKAAGFQTNVEEYHWLAKARIGEHFVDLIFGTGHGQLSIDDSWVARGVDAEILGVPVRLMPVEEMVCLGCYVAERNRFDASEVMHLIYGVKGQVDWERVLELLGPNRELLLWQLLLFDFIYPSHSNYLPHKLLEQLFDEVKSRWHRPGKKPNEFRGLLLDPFSYSVDVEDRGYPDRRVLDPLVNAEGELL